MYSRYSQISLNGPCLPHCYKCSPLTIWAARAALVYTLACLGYLPLTRGYGTPFADSLIPSQHEIKHKSSRDRANAFATSAVLAIVLVMIWRPFTPQ